MTDVVFGIPDTNDEPIITETPRFKEKYAFTVGWHVGDDVGFHDTWAALFYPGGDANGRMAFKDAFVTQAKMSESVAQGLAVKSKVLAAYGLAVAEALNLSSAFKALASYVLHERFSMKSALVTQAHLSTTIHDAMGFLAFLDQMRGAACSDAFQSLDAVRFDYRAGAAVREMIRLLDYPERMLVMRITVPDGFELDDAGLCNFIYNTGLSDEVVAEITYQQPGDTVATWAINTRTTAVTQYTNFSYNSFAPMGRKFLAANEDGLYELNGARDDTADVIGRIAGGFFPPSDGKLGGFKGVYLAANSAATWFLKLEAGDGRVYHYKRVSRPGKQNTKIDVGKGLRSRYFAWELIAADGQDFDLDGLEFVPMVSGRRI